MAEWFLFFCVVILVGLGAYSRYRPKYKSSSVPPSPPSPGSPTPTPPIPTPAPAARSKTYGWVWLLVGIMAAIIAYYIVLPAIQATSPAPQKTTAPKRELKKHELKIPLEFVGGENIVRKPGYIGIPKDGYANFRVKLPVVKNGKYKVHYHGQRIKEGRDFLEINRGKGNGAPFSIEHGASDFPIELVFFDEGYDIGMPGESKYFRTGENYLKLWADGNLLIQLDQPQYLEITYWE